MRFASPLWLAGALFALVVAAMFVVGGVRLVRATRRFGEPERVKELVTSAPARRRAWKGVLVVLATALAFFALARPEYGRGTRLVPATNLDVVIVLDYSKSMYARDVVPSRIARAKAEVARLIRDLPGARFGAVAFAGEPIGFPLTSDGAAIAQFFRQLDPNDMPIGGTAIARALERGRELLARDPKSREHSRVILLVTDGEDLEGDPVGVAKAAAGEGTVVHVVQIGGRTPERIPEIGEDGRVAGWRRDEGGEALTTALSAEGEAQLAEIAQVTGGQVIRSERGTTGIETIARELKRKMTDELAERVETVYADVYVYPLGAAILLLVLETFLAETARRSRAKAKAMARAAAAPSLLALFLFALSAGGCGWEPSRPFDRKAPEVEKALLAFDAGDAASATALLQSYLQTGVCTDAGIGAPDRLRERPNASFDLGLTLFQIGEQFGSRFGDEEGHRDGGPTMEEQQEAAHRSDQVECALRVVLTIASDPTAPVELRARARYLAGNLEFLRRQYEAAVRHYEAALGFVPGMADGGDSIGRDAAWNRAIALERIEDEKKRDAGKDADDEPDANDASDAKDEPTPDAPPDAPGDAGQDASEDHDEQPDGGGDGASGDDGGREDAGGDGGGQDAGAPPPSAEPPKPSNANEDERMLDMLEGAPTFQQQDAKNKAGSRKVRRGMVDK